MNVKDYELVFKIALIQTPFYLLFLYNSNILMPHFMEEANQLHALSINSY